jgi:outer membrane protein assembly factor BamE
MRILLIYPIIFCLSGCGAVGFPGVYRINVEQGNIVTQEMVDQLKPGMNRRQVRFILGTPLLEDSFNQSRWDYTYVTRNGRNVISEQQLTVFFEGDKLSHFSGTFTPGSDDSTDQPGPSES